MEREKIIEMIKTKKRTTLVKAFIQSQVDLHFEGCKQFGNRSLYLIIGEFDLIKKVIDSNREFIDTFHIDIINRNSNVGLLDYSKINARIEPGAIIREKVEIKDGAVILMGAIINIGASIGRKTMIDMNAVIGSNAQIGDNVHVGAGAVVSGVLEPPSSKPTKIGNNVFIGANAVILEGIEIGDGAIIGAGAVVTKNVPSEVIAVGVPARIVKTINNTEKDKVKNEGDLR